MANTLDSSAVRLIDNWPPSLHDDWAGPLDIRGLLGSNTHNALTSEVPLGTRFLYYEPGGTGIPSGWAVFRYLKVGVQHGDAAIAAKSILGLQGETAETYVWSEAGTAEQGWTVTNDVALPALSGLKCNGLCAIAISAMTDGYRGWFWTGGVCPETLIPGLGGDYQTDGNVAIGGMDLVAQALVAHTIGFGLAAASDVPVGISLLADD